MKHSTGNRTKAEQARFDAIKDSAICVACLLRGIEKPTWPGWIDIHHLLSGNKRIGHMATVGLCKWHHDGRIPFGWGDAETREYLGPSLKHGSKPFRAAFGTDAELLTIQNELLTNANP